MNDETDGETVRWMSYAELGRLRGTSAATARRMANRKHWKKLPGNDGTVRVAVPGEVAVSRETLPETSRETSRDTLSRAVAALETAVTTLTRQLGDARADRERLEFELRMAIAVLEEARAEARAAQEAAEAVRQAEEARKARGRWARVRAAWRGE
jgi:hypothetical protein